MIILKNIWCIQWHKVLKMMNRKYDLEYFYNKYQIKYEIVFRENTIYMRFFTGAMFEPKIFGNSMDKELLLKYYCII